MNVWIIERNFRTIVCGIRRDGPPPNDCTFWSLENGTITAKPLFGYPLKCPPGSLMFLYKMISKKLYPPFTHCRRVRNFRIHVIIDVMSAVRNICFWNTNISFEISFRGRSAIQLIVFCVPFCLLSYLRWQFLSTKQIHLIIWKSHIFCFRRNLGYSKSNILMK